MKKLFSLAIAILVTVCSFAQSPKAINYQAVARNNAGAALASQTIKVRLSIVQGASSLYSETRSVTTNLLGLFNVQIGSAGAASTTGNFGTIQWLNNTPAISLKVELDIANNNVFTDMGTQPLTSVPYSLATETANETKNLATRPLDLTAVPATGDVLQWNGTAWKPFSLPAAPTAGMWSGSIGTIPFGAAAAPWTWAGPKTLVTVDGTQKIIATATGVFGHGSVNPQPCSFAVCWSNTAVGSPLSPFATTEYLDGVIPASPNKSNLTGTGVVTLPAGTYYIGFAVKNKSTSIILNGNDFVNGSYMIIK